MTNSSYAEKKSGSHHEVASNMAKTDKSDPFMYARTMAHQQVGLHIIYSRDNRLENAYRADWRQEERTDMNGNTFKVSVPFNMSRP